jgi:CRISPR-associated endonuclease/helicase Cas3
VPERGADRFPDFFQAVRGREPFPWQADLARTLVDGCLPDVIDVPTGLGKTSVIDCWAYALAASADRQPRAIPLRLFFVVDRRLVVDGAYESAMTLAATLRAACDGSGVVGEVANALRSLHGDDGALQVVRMRGGVTWESRWLARPDQAAVVVGTVDQFGSRLLFRGYGVSDSMRPLDAALVGVDSWLVVDEAHIAEPLVQTVGRVRAHQQLTDLTRERGLRMTVMSATVAGTGEVLTGKVLKADLDEQATSRRFPDAAKVAAKRLNVHKPVALLDLEHLAKTGGKDWAGKAEQLGAAMAAVALGVDDKAMVVGVVANTIAAARAAHRQLVSKGEDAILLIGRVRGFERDRILERWIPQITVGGTRALERRLFVVATQTIEVGADLDLDALVTECAPLPALVQRFGRVNRAGDRGSRRSAVVHASSIHDDDPVYGQATARTWQWLGALGKVAMVDKKTVGRVWPSCTLDFGLRSVVELMRDAPADVMPETPFVPIALGSHFERWACTSPAPWPDQVLAPFLHGIDRNVPEVSIAWRAAPPNGSDDVERWKEWLDLVPPVEWESVSVPIWHAKAFLAGVESASPIGDVEGTPEPDDPPTDVGVSSELLGVVYRGRNGTVSPVRVPADVAPGDRIVLRSDVGGHDEWGWTGLRAAPGDPPVPDVGDLAPTRRRGVMRLSRSVLETWMPPGDQSLADPFSELDPEDIGTVEETLGALSGVDLPPPVAELVNAATGWRAYLADLADGAGPAVLLTAPPGRAHGGDAVSDDDESSTSQTAARVPLRDHGEQVGTTAARFARHLGLPHELVAAVELAGRCHDVGKAEPRFQLMLHDGDQLAVLVADEPLAKSGRDPRDPVARTARRLAGLPRGFRHEAVSARLFDTLTSSQPSLIAGVDVELVRHLIVSHHGKARPLLPGLIDAAARETRVDIDGQEVMVDKESNQVDWTQPARFEALNERYGWWGLAFLETLVRLADMWCSELGS